MATEKRAFTLEQALSVARQFAANDDRERATAILEQILAVAPDEPDALNGLAFMRYHDHRVDEAIDLIERAAQLAPGNGEVQINLGNIRLEGGDFEGAEAAYRESIRLMPANVHPLHNLALIACARNNLTEAEKLLKRALEIDPEFGPGLYNLAIVYSDMGRLQEAVELSLKAILHLPKEISPVGIVARAYARNGMIEEAIEVVKDWLTKDPENPDAQHMLSALQGDAPDRPTDEYIRYIFNKFANSFDSKLAKLKYRAPEHVADVVGEILGDAAGLDVLDAGCGTGLCAQYVRERAKSLVGVDLSKGMLAGAKRTGLYDELHEAELTAFAEDNPDSYDLIVCADTLCYFGSLTEPAGAFADAMRPGGLLVFTVEALPDDANDDYTLEFSGRYQHKGSYVRQVLEAAGFSVELMRGEVLRTEYGKPVNGHVVAARKP